MKNQKVAIRCKHVWLGTDYIPAVIVIDMDSGRIDGILPGSDTSCSCDEEFLAEDYYILPGLIDCHTHAGMAGPGGDQVDDINDPNHFDTPFFRAIDAADPFCSAFQNAKEAGITTVCVLPGPGAAVAGQAGVLVTASPDPFAYILRENAGMKVALGTYPRKCADAVNASPRTKMALYAMIKESFLRAKRAFHETPKERDLALEGWLPVLEGYAPMRVHCHREDDIIKIIRFADKEKIKIVLEHASDAISVADELTRRDIPVVCTNTLMKCPQFQEERSLLPDLPSQMMKRGISVALSTNFPDASWHALIAQASRCFRDGVPYRHVIESITLLPAKILGISDEMGTIATGKWADLSFWNGDIMNFRTRSLGVMIHGNLYMKKGLR